MLRSVLLAVNYFLVVNIQQLSILPSTRLSRSLARPSCSDFREIEDQLVDVKQSNCHRSVIHKTCSGSCDKTCVQFVDSDTEAVYISPN